MSGKAHESLHLSTGIFASSWYPTPASITPAKKRFTSVGAQQAEKGAMICLMPGRSSLECHFSFKQPRWLPLQ